jgi:centromere/kinetochore protein ZW10
MSEAESNTPEYALALYVTAKDVVKLFMNIVPLKHRKVIKEMPQTTALFYNNCFYLAHYLLSNEKVFQNKLNVLDSKNVVFYDLAVALYQLAEYTLAEQHRQQENIIIDFFQAPEVLQCLIDNTSRDENVLKPFELATKRSLTHISILKKCLANISPPRILNRVIGNILNAFLAEVIQRVVILDDISATSARQISLIIDSVSKNWLTLFENLNEDLSSLAPQCFVFGELKFMLNANLKEIVDRWTEGYGPLATAFTAEQVRHLIRALFQNSDKRSTALSLIR